VSFTPSLPLPTLDPQALARYARHLTLPGVGIEGQQRLAAASVLIVGAGGLGSPAAMYLAAAGVGHIGLVDDDTVDLSNLQRQLLHTTERVGQQKVTSGAETLRALNPLVQVTPVAARCTSATAAALMDGYDLVIDGSDNFSTRYAISDACVAAGVPYLYASVQRFEGQLSFFNVDDGPCYRCLFPQPPEPGSVPSCAEAGVFGVMPGLLGVLQASEALKYLTGTGTLLRGRLLLVDLAEVQTREIAFDRDPACPSCGTTSAAPETPSASSQRTPMLEELSPTQIRDRLAAGGDVLLIDVREPAEYATAHIAGAVLIPMRTLPQRLAEIPRTHDILLHCHHGMRSEMAGNYLLAQGFSRVAHMVGGIDRWSVDVDPAVPQY
jgi:sulfur-carrier protein adenylyltransferase/sulfurtransferase